MLNLCDLSFSYGDKTVLEHFSLSVKPGEIVAVMGASGCGKSTLLNLIAGLKKPTAGTVECHATRISYAFQEPRLFPWLTVEENLLAVLGARDDAAVELVDATLATVGLSNAKKLFPSELSGGMKSRVALARALAYGGDLYLLDEPFAALNEELRAELSVTLREKIKQSGASAILVTHQRADAECIADRILRLETK